MIGNATDAMRAVKGQLPLVGEGCMRRAYLSNGIVYKVERTRNQANVSEYEIANQFRNAMPHNVVIPDMWLHTVVTNRPITVLAMPYIDGQKTGECIGEWSGIGCDDNGMCVPEETMSIIAKASDDARTWGNVIVKDGVFYVIDLDLASSPS